MKKILSFIVLSIFIFFNYYNISITKGEYILSSKDRNYIKTFTGKFIEKTFNKKGQHEGIKKLVKIVKKIDLLKKEFKNRNDIKNKEKIFKVLELIKIKIKIELGNIESYKLSTEDKKLLRSILIIRNHIADSKFLESGIEVYKQGKNKIDTSKGGTKIYYIRFLIKNMFDFSDPINRVYLKKALYKNGRLSQNTFIAELGHFKGSENLYKIWLDTNNPPSYCYSRIENSMYKGTEFSGIKSNVIAYVSKSLDELKNKLKQNPNWKVAINKGGNLCQNGNKWMKFKANPELITEISKIPAKLNEIQ